MFLQFNRGKVLENGGIFFWTKVPRLISFIGCTQIMLFHFLVVLSLSNNDIINDIISILARAFLYNLLPCKADMVTDYEKSRI